MKVLVSGFSGRALSETAAKAGCDVSCIDFFGDLDLKKFCSRSFSIKRNSAGQNYSTEGLLKLIEKHYDKEQYFVYSSDWDNRPELLNKVLAEKEIKLLGNSAEVLKKISSKVSREKGSDIFSYLKKRGFNLPEIIKTGEELKKQSRINPDRKYLLKPYLSGGGKNITVYNNLNKAQKEIDTEMWGNFYLQQYIEGRVSSAIFAADGRSAEILGITEQLKDLNFQNSFRYGGNLLIRSTSDIIKKLQNMAESLSREYGLKGISGIDFILAPDGIYFIELNPRFTAAVELLLPIFGKELFNLYFSSSIDENLREKFIFSEMPLYAKVIYYAKSNLTVKKEITKLLDYKEINMSGKYEFRDLPHPGEYIEKTSPVCTVLIRAGSRQKLFELCRNAFSFLEEFVVEEV
ncbi:MULTISPECIES: ATP-grasp domain-containing protein [unclassified Halanaerobium]|uniref:ATP-grasp domain-containing protein n=1 Tax=unclassified Halanaerobium TaxID=2641197 RepID=UPI000DF40CD4|nr:MULTISPECIES: ATP-grasp domain-containing protein [unclassified Halanaerobium]RCW48746.1 hypothetical protein DFR78_10727 [Halanaerobium sp. MA284_MarDTE_T2]RCW89088.1 hypothetical protein DER71_10228 [Halanaerobium sp. DL-01]